MQTTSVLAEPISSEHLNMFLVNRISKDRVHVMVHLGQGQPRETVDVFFMLVLSLDIASPAHTGSSRTCMHLVPCLSVPVITL